MEAGISGHVMKTFFRLLAYGLFCVDIRLVSECASSPPGSTTSQVLQDSFYQALYHNLWIYRVEVLAPTDPRLISN
jgi:hypothetical protein